MKWSGRRQFLIRNGRYDYTLMTTVFFLFSHFRYPNSRNKLRNQVFLLGQQVGGTDICGEGDNNGISSRIFSTISSDSVEVIIRDSGTFWALYDFFLRIKINR